jgi:2-polyprenyl-3-methyl-5-hydroxy-6-metoxy-1,4-benzoquinol methylase
MNVSFEYLKKLSPFEVFLKYTNEKVETAKNLKEIISNKFSEPKKYKILDIGTGNGELISLTMGKENENVSLTLLEPSNDLSMEIHKQMALNSPNSKYKIVNSTFDDFTTSQKYDLILASHLYHVQLTQLNEFLNRCLEMLTDNGVLIFIWRQKDDVSTFKELFKPQINPKKYPKGWKAKVSEMVMETIDNEIPTVEYKLITKANYIKLPIQKSLEDVHAIVEFLLNTEWHDIKAVQRAAIMDYIVGLGGKFKQKEGYLLISRKAL